MVAMLTWGIIAIVVIILGYIVLTYNRLIVLRNRIDTAWSQINVQLKKRYDLIPNLVRTVKGYAKHEKTVFQNVTKARTQAIKAKNVKSQQKAENMLTEALKTVFAVAENYPKLEASKNFLVLQEELSGVEGKIAYARQFYNDTTLSYNNKVQKFPSNMIASSFGFQGKDYFKIAGIEAKPVKVEF